jgi:hypothetical protein
MPAQVAGQQPDHERGYDHHRAQGRGIRRLVVARERHDAADSLHVWTERLAAPTAGDREAHRRLVLLWTLRERWERLGRDERLSGDEIALVLVMSHHAHTFNCLRLSPDSREQPRHLCGTLEHREDLSFGVDEQKLHGYVSPARHRRRSNAASPIS